MSKGHLLRRRAFHRSPAPFSASLCLVHLEGTGILEVGIRPFACFPLADIHTELPGCSQLADSDILTVTTRSSPEAGSFTYRGVSTAHPWRLLPPSPVVRHPCHSAREAGGGLLFRGDERQSFVMAKCALVYGLDTALVLALVRLKRCMWSSPLSPWIQIIMAQLTNCASSALTWPSLVLVAVFMTNFRGCHTWGMGRDRGISSAQFAVLKYHHSNVIVVNNCVLFFSFHDCILNIVEV